VALKRIQEVHAQDGESQRRFLLEAEITGRLEHPGIVPVYGLIEGHNGRPCYAMRFIEGESLKDAIERLHGEKGDPREGRLALRRLLVRFVALERWLAGEAVSAWREPWTVRLRRWAGRRRTLVAGVASALVVALLSMSARARLRVELQQTRPAVLAAQPARGGGGPLAGSPAQPSAPLPSPRAGLITRPLTRPLSCLACPGFDREGCFRWPGIMPCRPRPPPRTHG
jgi:hypothetical protein